MATKSELSPVAKEVLGALREAGRPLTLAELKEMGINANGSHLKALKNRGLVDSEVIEKEVQTVTKRKINQYVVIDADTDTEVED